MAEIHLPRSKGSCRFCGKCNSFCFVNEHDCCTTCNTYLPRSNQASSASGSSNDGMKLNIGPISGTKFNTESFLDSEITEKVRSLYVGSTRDSKKKTKRKTAKESDIWSPKPQGVGPSSLAGGTNTESLSNIDQPTDYVRMMLASPVSLPPSSKLPRTASSYYQPTTQSTQQRDYYDRLDTQQRDYYDRLDGHPQRSYSTNPFAAHAFELSPQPHPQQPTETSFLNYPLRQPGIPTPSRQPYLQQPTETSFLNYPLRQPGIPTPSRQPYLQQPTETTSFSNYMPRDDYYNNPRQPYSPTPIFLQSSRDPYSFRTEGLQRQWRCACGPICMNGCVM